MMRRVCIVAGLVLMLVGTMSCGRKAPLLPVPDDIGGNQAAAFSGQYTDN